MPNIIVKPFGGSLIGTDPGFLDWDSELWQMIT